MEYSDELLRETLPEERPPRQYVPSPVLAEIEGWSSEDYAERRDLVARSTEWTYAMFAELQAGRTCFEGRNRLGWLAFRLLRRSVRFTIGLFDQAGFGLTIHIPRLIFLPRSWDLGRLRFKRLDKSFPVRLQQAEVEDHHPPHPEGATSAAWADCNRSDLRGFITAGHAVGEPGAAVTLSTTGAGLVARSGLPHVDAAFVESTDRPSSVTKLPIRRFPATGQRVHIWRKSDIVDRTVVGVENNMGVVHTLSRAALLYTDQGCARGDSGALVSAGNGPEVGDGVGIYLGVLKDLATGARFGRVLSLEQAAYALEVTPYG